MFFLPRKFIAIIETYDNDIIPYINVNIPPIIDLYSISSFTLNVIKVPKKSTFFIIFFNCSQHFPIL